MGQAGKAWRLRGRRRMWLAALLAVVLVVVLSPPPQGGGFPGLPGSLAHALAWLRDPFRSGPPLPATPRQESCTAHGKGHYAPAGATRAGAVGTSGRSPGLGAGELEPYRPHTPATRPGPSGLATDGHNYDAKTSQRIASAASATSDVYRNADGSYTRMTYAGVVNYRATDGSWQRIDPMLTRGTDGRLRARANGTGVAFAGTADDASLASVTLSGGISIAYGLRGAAAVRSTVDGATARYVGVLRDTDLELSSVPAGMKETLVLRSASAPTSWDFPLRLNGVTAAVAADGSVEFRDGKGTVVATVPRGYLADSAFDPRSGLSAESHGLRYRIVTVDGGPAIEMTADAAWLQDPKRVYPVRIDPSVNEYPSASTFADTVNTGDNSGNVALRVGTPDGGGEKAYSFLQFANFGARYAGNRITGAVLHVFDYWAYNCGYNRWEVDPVTAAWTPSAVQGYPGPPFRSNIGWSNQAAPHACANGSGGGYHNPAVGDWLTAALDPNLFAEWVAGSPNYGLALNASQSDSTGWKLFDSVNAPNPPYVEITYTPDAWPQVDTQYPPDNYNTPTLTPQLLAIGHDPDNWPGPLRYQFTIVDPHNNPVASSGLIGTGNWVVPSGKLQWGRSYYWTVQTYDGYSYSDGNAAVWRYLGTPVPQPVITSGLSQNPGHGFEPSIGNYTTSATDASVATAGPVLSIRRDYNSADPRSGGAFGTGWSSLLDQRAAEQRDAGGAVVTVTVTYPTGEEVAFGRNADGSFTPPQGRFATLKAVAGGYTLTDKNATVYTFTHPTPVSGVFGVASVADPAGRTDTFIYTGSQVTAVTSGVSGRALHLTWTTPSGATAAHVATVQTDPVDATDPATALTWTYSYTGDSLVSVCQPTSATACTRYGYSDNSLYPDAVLNTGPHSYWRLGEAGGTVASSAVLTNEGSDNGTYVNVTLGQPGPLPGGTATAAGFNGTSSAVTLPPGLVQNTTYQSIGMWFKTTSTATGTLFSTGHSTPGAPNPDGGAMPVLYVGSDGKLYGHFWDTTVPGMASTRTVNDGAWHHVVLTAAGNTQTLYLDGSPVGTLNGQLINIDPIDIVGAGVFNSNGWPAAPSGDMWNYFNGSISDVAFYTRPLSAGEIGQIYGTSRAPARLLSSVTRPSGKVFAQIGYDRTAGTASQVTDENGGVWKLAAPTTAGTSQVYVSTVREQNPSDYWRLGEAPGATDAVNQVHGRASGTYHSVGLGVSGPFADATAASFDGASSWLRLPDHLVDASTTLSLGLWFRTTSSSAGTLLSTGNSLPGTANPSPAAMPVLYVGSDGKLHGHFWDGTAPGLASPGRVNDGKWHLAILASVGANQTLYLDGASLGTLYNTVSNLDPYDLVGVGVYNNNGWPAAPSGNTWNYFNGSISDVAFFRGALSVAQVDAQWAAFKSSTGPTPVSTVRITDPTGKTSSYSYDPLAGNRVVSRTDALGHTTTVGYDTEGFEHTVTDPNGVTTTTGHDIRGNIVSRTTCQSQPNTCATTYFTYYPDDTSASPSPDPRNDLVLSVRDGRSTSATDNTYLTSTTYDAVGNRTSVTTPPVAGYPAGRTTTTTYTTASTPAVGGGTAPAGMPASVTSAGGAKQTFAYYRSGDLAQTTDPAGLVTTYTYDGLGRLATRTVVSDTYPAGLTTTFRYDALGRPVTQTDPAVTNRVTGAVHTPQTTTTYDADGNATSTTASDLTGGDAARTTTTTYNTHGQVATVTDATGATTTYAYDAYGNRTAEIDPAGTETDYAYDAVGQLLTETLKGFVGDPANPGTPSDLVLFSNAYDPAGRKASTVDAMGWTASYTYTDNGLPATITRTDTTRSPAPSFVSQNNRYDAANHLIERRTNNNATDTTYTVDAAGRVTSSTVDPGHAARTTRYTYSADDTVLNTQRTDPTGATRSVDETYDPLGRPTSQTVHNGTTPLTTTWTLDRRGLPVAQTDPLGITTGYTYDEAGHRTVITGPVVQVEAPGSLPVAVRPVALLGYDTFGARTEAADPDGNVTTYGYDATGRLLTTQLPRYTPPGSSTAINATATHTYNSLGQVVADIDPLGNRTTYTYDQLGRQATVTRADGTVTHHTYDADGDLLATTDPTGAQTQTTYDYLRRRVTTTQVERQPTPAAYTTTYGYDDDPATGTGGGWLKVSTSPAGVRATDTHDNLGELTAGTNGAGNITGYAYNLVGDLTTVTNPDGTSTVATFDQAGRVTAVSDRDSTGATLRTRTAAYDNDGRAITTTDGRGTTETFGYDDAGRLVAQSTPIAGSTVTTVLFGYDAAGNQTRFTDGRGNAFLTSYNSWNLAESTIEPATPSYPNLADRTFSVGYDADGRIATQQEPGGVTVTDTYDTVGNLSGQAGTGAEASTTARSLGYDGAGRMTSASAPGGTDTFGYDDRGLLTSTAGPSGSAAFGYDPDGRMASRTDTAGTSTYTYDVAGRLVTLTDAATGARLSYGYNNLSQLATVNYGGDVRTFGYDTLHRLTDDTITTSTGAPVAGIRYGYDADDNLTSKTTAGYAGSAANTYTYDLANRLTSWSNGTTTTAYGYDTSGNRTQIGAQTYTYDARNALVSGAGSTYRYTARGTLAQTITGGQAVNSTSDAFDQTTTQGTQSYQYDALARVVSAGTVTFSYFGTGNLLASDGSTTYSRDPSGGLVGERTGGTAVLAVTDDHTDVVGQLTPAGTALTGSVAYDPLGNVIAATTFGGNLGYQSGWTDHATGRVNMAARWYNPATGQFDNRDSIGPSPVPNPLAANRYAYGDDNPLTHTDPTGHCAINDDGDLCVGHRVRPGLPGPVPPPPPPTIIYHHSNHCPDGDCQANPMPVVRQYIGTTPTTPIHHPNDAGLKPFHPILGCFKGCRSQPAQTVYVHPGKVSTHDALGACALIPEVGALCDAENANIYVDEHKYGTAALYYTYAVLDLVDISDFIKLDVWISKALGKVVARTLERELVKDGETLVEHEVQSAAEAVAKDADHAHGGPESGPPPPDRPAGGNTGGGNPRTGNGSGHSGTTPHNPKTNGGGSPRHNPEANTAAPAARHDVSAGPPAACHSFDPNTRVLLADRSTKPIKDVRIGDRVAATDPATGTTTARTVTALHDNHDTDLADVQIRARDGSVTTLRTTWHHPFWNADSGTWTDAGQLTPGTRLGTADGRTEVVVSIQISIAVHDMRDLTVADIHTYYVIAGTTPVLVHNCNTTPTDLHAFGNAGGPRAPREGIDFYVGDDGMVVPQSGPTPHGASTFGDPAQAPLSGVYHRIPGGTELPDGFGVVADGEDVLPGSGQPPTHHTIYPTQPMTPQDYIDGFLNLPWVRAGRK
jgi:large repetitive protein